MITADHISKRYYLYSSPWAKVRELVGLGSGGGRRREFWALRDVSLRVGRGQTLGVIGPNGAGKSTLLKVLTGITRPTSGQLEVKGKVAALLELGTGFHPEFTGRQNIHINGKMLGLSDAEIRAREQEIIAFAEIGPFIDQPLRTYSTGMAMRLGFAIGVAAHPDVFIIDEVLAVGDAYFSQKCFRKLEQIRDLGTTILFVSHDMNAIVRLCDEAVLLNEGRIEAAGVPRDIIEYYTQLIAGRNQALIETPPHGRTEEGSRRYGSREALIAGIEMRAEGRKGPGDVFVSGTSVVLRLHVVFLADIEEPTIGILIRDRVGYDVFGTNTVWMRQATGRFSAGEEAVFEFSFPLDLAPNQYTITAAVHYDETHLEKCFDWIEQVYSFKVVDGPDFRCYGAARLHLKLKIEHLGVNRATAGTLLAELFNEAPANLGMDDTAAPYLLSGWFAPERGQDGRIMRWTGREALFVLCPKGPQVAVECLAAGRSEPVTLTLFDMERVLGAKRLEPDQSAALSWKLAQDETSESVQAPPGPRMFRLRVSSTTHGPSGEDPRELGVLVFAITSS
ncbi:MAG: hypothetical protein Kow0059_04330 [Candidatus Sumerlaeia bacterium]